MKEIVEPLLDWYQKNKRSLAWRKDKNPYHIWVSEIMLQQTRVEAVKKYYQRFMETLPNLENLAYVEEDELLKLWEGLGYYSRARNLKKAAIEIMENYGGEFPETYEELLHLQGIGPYTAGAISSIAFNQKTPAIDGNVIRVMLRLKNSRRSPDDALLKKELFKELSEIMPNQAGDFNQALMDLGATICIPNTYPNCEICPLKQYCRAYADHNALNIPVAKKKITKKKEQYTIIILKNKEHIAIRKRATDGLLANLYEFYTVSGKMSLPKLKKFLTEQGILYTKVKQLGEAKHIFTHKIWHMYGYLVETERQIQGFEWVEIKDIFQKYSIPTAFSKYKEQIIEHKEN